MRRVDSELLLLVARPPAAAVGGLVQGDAVDPGLQTGVTMEAPLMLRKTFRKTSWVMSAASAGVMQAAGDDGVDGLMILGDEQGECGLRTGLSARRTRAASPDWTAIALARLPIAVPACIPGVLYSTKLCSRCASHPIGDRCCARRRPSARSLWKVRHVKGAFCSPIFIVFRPLLGDNSHPKLLVTVVMVGEGDFLALSGLEISAGERSTKGIQKYESQTPDTRLWNTAGRRHSS